MKVMEFYEGYFENYQEENMAENTWRTRISMMRVHVLPLWGDKELDEIKAHNIDELYDLMRAKGLKRNTLFGMQSALGSFFNLAVDNGFITSSPMRDATRIKPDDGSAS